MSPNALVTLTALAPSIPGLPGGGSLFGSVAAALALPMAGAIYVLLFWGKRSQAECSWRDDDQIGLKVIVGTLILVGTGLLAGGLQGLLHLLLTFKNFGPRIKSVLPDLLVGAAVIGGAIMFAVPKTNHAQQPKALRLVAGAIALTGAIATVVGLDDLLKTVFQWPGWHEVAGSLTSLITAVVVFAGAGYMYAMMIGVEVPDIPMPAGMPQGQPQQGQAQVQPQQAQPQQQAGGYQQPQAQPQVQPQQAGGYPPQQQGGGYPPQQQGGGYQGGGGGGSAPPRPGGGSAPPPPGGGGYPPPGGGGYGQ